MDEVRYETPALRTEFKSPQEALAGLSGQVEQLFGDGGQIQGRHKEVINLLPCEMPAHDYESHVQHVEEKIKSAFKALEEGKRNPEILKKLLRNQFRDQVAPKKLASISWTPEDYKILAAAASLHDIGVLRVSREAAEKEYDPAEHYAQHVIRGRGLVKYFLSKKKYEAYFSPQDIERVEKLIAFTEHGNFTVAEGRPQADQIKTNPADSEQLKLEIMGNLLRQTDNYVYVVDQDMMRHQANLYGELSRAIRGTRSIMETKFGRASLPEWLADPAFMDFVREDSAAIFTLLEDKEDEEQFWKNYRDRREVGEIMKGKRKDDHRHLEGAISADDIWKLAEDYLGSDYQDILRESREEIAALMRGEKPLEEDGHEVISRLATPWLKRIVSELRRRGDKREILSFFSSLGVKVSFQFYYKEGISSWEVELAPLAYVEKEEVKDDNEAIREAIEILAAFQKGLSAFSLSEAEGIPVGCTLRRDKDGFEENSRNWKLVEALRAENQNRQAQEKPKLVNVLDLAGDERVGVGELRNFTSLIEDNLEEFRWLIHAGELDVADSGQKKLALVNFKAIEEIARGAKDKAAQQGVVLDQKIGIINPTALSAEDEEIEPFRKALANLPIILSMNPLGRPEEKEAEDIFVWFMQNGFENLNLATDNPALFGGYSPLSLSVEYWLAYKAWCKVNGKQRPTEADQFDSVIAKNIEEFFQYLGSTQVT